MQPSYQRLSYASYPWFGVPGNEFYYFTPPKGKGSLGVEALDLKSWDQESSFQPVFGSQRGRKETRIRSVDRLALVENTDREATNLEYR